MSTLKILEIQYREINWSEEPRPSISPGLNCLSGTKAQTWLCDPHEKSRTGSQEWRLSGKWHCFQSQFLCPPTCAVSEFPWAALLEACFLLLHLGWQSRSECGRPGRQRAEYYPEDKWVNPSLQTLCWRILVQLAPQIPRHAVCNQTKRSPKQLEDHGPMDPCHAH